MNRDISYTEHFFAYIDIMGYKCLINEVEKGEKDAIEVISSLKELIEERIQGHIDETNTSWRDSDYSAIIKYIIFSDCICLYAPTYPERKEMPRSIYSDKYSQEYIDRNYILLNQFILMVADIQMFGLRNKLIFRGAITMGNHYSDNTIMFSKALVDAYLAETNDAIYPRVIIKTTDDNYLGMYQTINGLINDGKALRDGNSIFVDYIGRINALRYINPELAKMYILFQRQIIIDGIENNKDNMRVLEKYKWLAEYYNYMRLESLGTDAITFDSIISNINSKIVYPAEEEYEIPDADIIITPNGIYRRN